MTSDASTVLEEIRVGCAWVAARASHVRLRPERIGSYAGELTAAGLLVDPEDPAMAPLGPSDEADAGVEQRALFCVALDAVNFGSGWFPVLRKRPGMSGYHTVATAFDDQVREHGLTAAWLAAATTERCADLFGQERDGPTSGLMEAFAESWHLLGDLLIDRFDGRVLHLIEACAGSAARLVSLLAEHHPLYRDVSVYDGRAVPLYKRAQITATDLHATFGGEGPGRFDDRDRLTAFADNLVPHVLRLDGVLTFDDDLISRIDAGELLEHGSPEEVEIRGVAVHAVELLVAEMQRQGAADVTAADLDAALWHRGAGEPYKATPRHRCRTTAY